MYLADQYTKPKGDFTTVYSADGAMWYKQYAQDTVVRKPYNAPDGTVAYYIVPQYDELDPDATDFFMPERISVSGAFASIPFGCNSK